MLEEYKSESEALRILYSTNVEDACKCNKYYIHIILLFQFNLISIYIPYNTTLLFYIIEFINILI